MTAPTPADLVEELRKAKNALRVGYAGSDTSRLVHAVQKAIECIERAEWVANPMSSTIETNKYWARAILGMDPQAVERLTSSSEQNLPYVIECMKSVVKQLKAGNDHEVRC